MTKGDDFRTLVQQSAEEIEIDFSIRSELADSELRALPHRQHLPRDEIRVVIHRCNNDLVTACDIRYSPRAGDEVQPFSRATREDETVGITNAKKLRSPNARLVIELGCPHRKRVRPAMRIRVCRLVEIAQRVENDSGLLRRRGRVEVVEARIVRQQRKIRANLQIRGK